MTAGILVDLILGAGVLTVVFILGIGVGRLRSHSDYFRHVRDHLGMLQYFEVCQFCRIDEHVDSSPDCQYCSPRVGGGRAH